MCNDVSKWVCIENTTDECTLVVVFDVYLLTYIYAVCIHSKLRMCVCQREVQHICTLWCSHGIIICVLIPRTVLIKIPKKIA